MTLFGVVPALIAGLLVATPAVAAPAVAAPTAVDATAASATAPVSAAQPAAVGAGPVKAADLSKFRPGNIISDAVFFDKNTMTEAQIQSFLRARVPSCQSGYTCLKDKFDVSRTTSADAMCASYRGGVRESAARIIYKVAQACGINPQVILTTLQKEQGLVTHTWPSEWRYTIAMGQGCPDTAACDTRYYGFFNQVFGAAWQLKRYANPPGTSNYFNWYAPGRTWNVRWHPNAACGSSPVYIENQATANLYYYTPYQPNAAAIRAYSGTGDGCSSYGNRNFYRYFTDWFGSTQVGADPCAQPADARTAVKAYVVEAGSLNARLAPNTTCSKQVTSLSQGTVVQAVAVKGDWLKVNVGTVDRWVSRDYLRYASSAEASCALPGGVGGAKLTYVVNVPKTVLRAVPDAGCDSSATQLSQGAIVRAVQVNDERTWVRVHTGNGDQWVNRSELRRASSTEAPCALPKTIESARLQYVVQSSGSTGRVAPNSGCGMGSVAVSGGTVVQAIEVNGPRDWLRVTTGKGEMWIARDHLSRSSSSAACAVLPAERTATRSYVVSTSDAVARTTPSTACGEATVPIAEGTVLTPLSSTSAGDWLKVRHANRDLWIARSDVQYASADQTCSAPVDTRTAKYTYRVVVDSTAARSAPRTGCGTDVVALPAGTIATAVEVTADGEWLKLDVAGGLRWVYRADTERYIE